MSSLSYEEHEVVGIGLTERDQHSSSDDKWSSKSKLRLTGESDGDGDSFPKVGSVVDCGGDSFNIEPDEGLSSE